MKTFLSIFFLFAVCFSAFHASQAQTSDAALTSPVNLSLSSEAIEAGIGGRMTLSVKVDADGRVKDARVVGGPSWPCGTSPKALLDEVRKMTTTNFKQALFTPAMKKGKPTGSDVIVTVDLDRLYRDIEKRRSETAGESRPIWPIVGGVLNGRAKLLPRPEYPRGVRPMRLTGAVTVQILIGTDGTVKSAGALSGHPQLWESARDAACRARFSTTTLDGKPIEVSGVITYGFN